MPPQNSRPPIASTLAILAGCGIVFGSLLLILPFPNLHLGIAIAIGAILGTPFIVLGLWLHPQSTPRDGISGKFWPTRTEVRRVLWGVMAFVALGAVIYAPIALLIFIGYFLPSGDNWGIVTMRLLFVVLAALSGYWCLGFASKTIPDWFRGRLPDETLDFYKRDKLTEPPGTAVAEAIKNWESAVIALVALCVATGVIDFEAPWLKIDGAPRRARGLMHLILWCRGNPNTVRSAAVLLGTAASAWYVFQIFRAAGRPKANAPDSQDAKIW